MKIEFETHILDYGEYPFLFHRDIISHTTFTANWHDDLELLYVEDGEGVIFCNSTPHSVKQGDLFIVNKNFIHCPSSNDSMTIFCLILQPQFCINNHIDISSVLFHDKIHDQHIMQLFKQFIDESDTDNKDVFHKNFLMSALTILLIYLLRNYSSLKPHTNNDNNIAIHLQSAIHYMEHHFSEKITSAEVAKHINFSKYYFLHKLKEYTGYTYTELLNRIRCINAQRLLIENELSIFEISYQCGYDNSPYFTRAFKEIYGCSPLQFKKKHMNATLN